MQLSTLKNDSAFQDAVVPAGYLLIFYGTDAEGKVTKMYKDSNGNIGSM